MFTQEEQATPGFESWGITPDQAGYFVDVFTSQEFLDYANKGLPLPSLDAKTLDKDKYKTPEGFSTFVNEILTPYIKATPYNPLLDFSDKIVGKATRGQDGWDKSKLLFLKKAIRDDMILSSSIVFALKSNFLRGLY